MVEQHLARNGPFATRLEAVRSAVQQFGHRRDLHQHYYSWDVVRDTAARRQWRTPDLQPLDASRQPHSSA